MSTTSNTLNGLRTNGMGWERKYIMRHDLVQMKDESMESILEAHREWMLGGKHFEWRYRKDCITGDLILERR